MINLAIIKYTFLLAMRRWTLSDFVFHAINFVGIVLMCMLGPAGVQLLLGLLCNPMFLLFVSWRYVADMMTKGAEYHALLFSRPITRVSYIFTKTLIAWLGAQFIAYKLLLMLLVAQLILGIKPLQMPSPWDLLTLAANAFGFSCLAIATCRLPKKWIGLGLIVLFGSYMGGSTQLGLLGKGLPRAEANQATVALSQLICPFIDLESVFRSATFSFSPIISFISNALIFLTIATVLINRTEFTYAHDQSN